MLTAAESIAEGKQARAKGHLDAARAHYVEAAKISAVKIIDSRTPTRFAT